MTNGWQRTSPRSSIAANPECPRRKCSTQSDVSTSVTTPCGACVVGSGEAAAPSLQAPPGDGRFLGRSAPRDRRELQRSSCGGRSTRRLAGEGNRRSGASCAYTRVCTIQASRQVPNSSQDGASRVRREAGRGRRDGDLPRPRLSLRLVRTTRRETTGQITRPIGMPTIRGESRSMRSPPWRMMPKAARFE